MNLGKYNKNTSEYQVEAQVAQAYNTCFKGSFDQLTLGGTPTQQ